MTIRYFEGSAGTGKTTSVIAAVDKVLDASPLREGEKVLALTFMHGARHRLTAKLAAVPSLQGRFDCQTIDSFAWRLVRRWRSKAMQRWCEEAVAADNLDFERNCQMASVLLEEGHVGRWVSKTYPLVVVDESQDCRGGRLRMLVNLAAHADILAAADAFQDLTSDSECPAVDWLAKQANKVPLLTCHRTKKQGLLAGATALRTNQPLVPGAGLMILAFPSPAMALHKIAAELFFYGPVTILTPTGRSKSPFVEEICSKLEEGPVHLKTLGKHVGPFRIRWECSHEEEVQALLQALSLPQGEGARVALPDLVSRGGACGCREIHDWAQQQVRLRGLRDFPVEEVVRESHRVMQRRRAHRRPTFSAHQAMTIHQAKNQEFHRVVVLWPYNVKGDDEHQRRLLYNAITRARDHALVVVQNNPSKDDRLKRPPFTPA